MKEKDFSFSEITDEELMHLYQEGEEKAFEEIYGRYSSRIYGYLKKRIGDPEKTDEVFQEIFMKFHRMRSKYKTTLPFAPWIFTLVRNVTVDHFRKMRNLSEPVLAGQEFLEGQVDESISTPVSEVGLKLVSGMDKLSERQKQAVELRYMDEKTFEEIGKTLDTSEINARKILSRAISKLRGN